MVIPQLKDASYFYWPFIDYTMYSKAHYPGDSINRYVLFGILKDSREVSISSFDLGLTFYQFINGLVPAMIKGETAKIQLYVQLYERNHGKSLVGLRLENHPIVLSRERSRPGAIQALKTIWVE